MARRWNLGIRRKGSIGRNHDPRQEPHSLGAEPSGYRVQYRLQPQAALLRLLRLQSRDQEHRVLLHELRGELTIGPAIPDPDGKALLQEFDILHTDGKVGHIRSTIVRDGNDAYWFTVFIAEGWRVGAGIQDSV